MNLEQLTKHQIVLLTLMVSFVTSVVTGIVTVSLMGQAPPGITKTINQIVEHTVEKVVPTVSGPATTTVNTVVVKDDDLVAQSIAAVQKSVIRIVAAGDTKLIARAIIVNAKGTALSDQAAFDASGATSFEAILSDGKRVPVSVRKSNASTTPLATLDVAVGTSTGFAPATLADLSKLQLGQSVVRISGTGSDVVGDGVIAALPNMGTNEIEASVGASTPGSVLFSIFGEVIGLTTASSQNDGADFYTVLAQPAAASPTATKPSSSS